MKVEFKNSKRRVKQSNRQKAQEIIKGRRTKCICAICGEVVDYEPELQLGSLRYCEDCFDFMRDFWVNQRRD